MTPAILEHEHAMTVCLIDPFEEIVVPDGGFFSVDPEPDLRSADGVIEYRIRVASGRGTPEEQWLVELHDLLGETTFVVRGFAGELSALDWAAAHARAKDLFGFPYLRADWAVHRWQEARGLDAESPEVQRVRASLPA